MTIKVVPKKDDLEAPPVFIQTTQNENKKTCKKHCEDIWCNDMFGKKYCCRTIFIFIIFLLTSIYIIWEVNSWFVSY